MARPKSFNKEHVLGLAMMVFWKQGFDATSMKDLEVATRLTPGSIYHEFGSKLGMFEHVLNHYIDTVVAFRVAHYFSQTENPMQSVREFLVSSFKGVPKEVRGDACLLVNTATELGKTKPSVSAVVSRGFKTIEKGLYKQLQLAQVSGNVREDLDCQAAARQLTLLMSGLLVASKNQSSVDSLESTVDFTLLAYQ
ncbi:hypothetical protein A9Q81_22040 [Gammaproteobacteria bacterium 42_54_T18]|nr:hypothetical protein A9Q81_22040 [Gammaproteobacteria bacterium 42_54_T18]